MLGLISAALSVSVVLAQQAQPVPPESKQFEFWVGKWDCTTMQDGKLTNQKGTNQIKRTLDGHIVEENFKMGGFVGRSWSVFNKTAKIWQQTWVDNNGGYIDLNGQFKDGRMVLVTVPKPKAPNNFNRMIFENITKDKFDWKWEGSTDGGKTWKLAWHLVYTRRK